MGLEEVATIILAAATGYNYIVTARVRAQQKSNDERVHAMEIALETERETVASLRVEIDRLRAINVQLEMYIDKLRHEVKQKDEIIFNLKNNTYD